MRLWVALLALGWLAVIVESLLVDGLPIRFVPALGFVSALVAAIAVPGVPGLLLAFALGLGSDMLSGALLGQHAMVRLFEFAIVRIVAGQLDLRRGLPLVVVAALLTAFDAAAFAAQSRLFLGALPFAWSELATWIVRALVTGITAPLLQGIAARIGDALSEDPRREMRLETRRPTL